MNSNIKTGISTASFYPSYTDEAFAYLCENGIKNIEVFINTYCEMKPPIINNIKRLADEHNIDDETLCKGLVNASAIGYLLMRNASVSGAEAGCQAEVGAASAMAASATVGDVSAIYLKSKDQVDNAYETKINTTKSFLKPETTYSQVDTAMRQLCSLSFNTYDDTLLITSVSVNYEMEDEGA